MAFDEAAFWDSLNNYMRDCVTLEIVDYIGDTNPIGGPSLGVNVDVGEVNSFDLRIKNNGPLGLLNVVVELLARRGQISLSFSGLVNLAGSQWMAPWATRTDVRPVNVPPNQSVLVRHQFSGGHLFGYQATEVTGGTDNARDVETLITATVKSWLPDLSSAQLDVTKGPQDTWRNFIQRS